MMNTPKRLGLITSRVALADDLEALVARQQPPELMLRLAEAAQAVLHDDHRAVDDQAEVERAQAHQVAADPGSAPCR